MKLRRYPKRTLRDVETSRWVTLSQVSRALADGEELQVTDSRTGNDCTALVVAQLLYQLAQKGPSLPAAPLVAYYRAQLSARPKPAPGEVARQLEEAIFEAERKRKR